MGASLEFAVETAERAGELLLRHSRHGDLHARLKPDYTLVTEADLAADRLIGEAIGREYPGDQIISEEGQSGYREGHGAVWIVDPLDGTANFALGFPVWGVSIARVVDNQVDVAVANFPALDELYSATAGQGAFLNGSPTRVSLPDEGHGVGAIACCSRTLRRYRINLPYKVRVLGAAAYTLCSVARGAAAVAVEMTPKLWDVAAARLIISEAGGVVEPLNGGSPFPLDAGTDYSSTDFPTLAAAGPELAAAAREAIELRTV